MINSMNKQAKEDLVDRLLEDWDFQRADPKTEPIGINLRVRPAAVE